MAEIFLLIVFGVGLWAMHNVGVRHGRKEMYWEMKREKLHGTANPKEDNDKE